MAALGAADTLFVVVLILVCIVGVSTSWVLMWLINDLQARHDFNRLIFYMAAFDAIYYLFYLCGLFNLPGSSQSLKTTSTLLNIVQLVGGTASYIISGYISFLVVNLLVYSKVWNIKKWAPLLVALVVVPNIIWVTITLVGLFSNNKPLEFLGLNISVYIRLIPILFNIVCYIISRIKVAETNSKRRIKSPQEIAIGVLVDRLKYYPILQVLSRILPTWLAIQFNNETSSNKDLDFEHPYYYWLTIANQFSLLINPVGFLVVYLVMQKAARIHLFNCIRTRFGINFGDSSSSNRNAKDVDNIVQDNSPGDAKNGAIYDGEPPANSNGFDLVKPKSKSRSASVLSGGTWNETLSSQWNEMDDSELMEIIGENSVLSELILSARNSTAEDHAAIL